MQPDAPPPSSRSDATSADALASAAGILLDRDAEQARRLAERALREDPRHAIARHHLGEALARLGQLERGRALLREAVQQDPRLADIGGGLPDPDAAPAGVAWIGGYPMAECPLCGEAAGKLTWTGNLTRAVDGCGRLDPVRSWLACEKCGLLRVEAPVPAAGVAAWKVVAEPCGAPPPDPATLGAEMKEWEPVIARIREAGHGDGWMTREGNGLPRPTLLDIGPGWGAAAAAAQWRGFAVHSVLDDEEAARFAQRRLEVPATCGTAPDDLPGAAFEVVLLRQDLSTAEDPVGVLLECADRLFEDGLLAVVFEPADHPVHRLAGYDAERWSDPAARTWFDRSALTLALMRAGLQPETAFAAPGGGGREIVLARRTD